MRLLYNPELKQGAVRCTELKVAGYEVSVEEVQSWEPTFKTGKLPVDPFITAREHTIRCVLLAGVGFRFAGLPVPLRALQYQQLWSLKC